METKNLEKAGLTKNESIVYVSLLKLGQTTAQNILKESKLHRSRVYDTLESLQNKGLVSFVIKDFKKYFQAENPEKLLNYVEEQRTAVKQIIPSLKKLENSNKEEIKATIYKGKEGLKTVHSQMLKQGKEILVLGGKGLIFSELEYFMPHFEKERIKKRIKWKILGDNKEIIKEISKRKLIQGKTLPKGYESNSVVNIFGNKVAIVLWKEKYPSAFVIENKEVADSFRKWFNIIYNSSAKLKNK